MSLTSQRYIGLVFNPPADVCKISVIYKLLFANAVGNVPLELAPNILLLSSVYASLISCSHESLDNVLISHAVPNVHVVIPTINPDLLKIPNNFVPSSLN